MRLNAETSNRATLAHSMPKWIAIRASAAIAIAGSMATLLFSAALAVVVLLTPPRETGPLPAGAMKIAGVAVAALFAGGAVWGICSGIGVLRRRNWARVSMMLFAGLLALLGATGALAAIVFPFGDAPDIDHRMAAVVRAAMVALYALGAALGAWWLALFTRRTAVEYFGAPEPATEQRPMSVGFIAWPLLASAVFTAVAAVLRFPVDLFGLSLGGWAAAAFYTLFTGAQLYLGSGLLQLDNTARAWSIAYFSAMAAWGGAIAFAPGFREKALELTLTLEGYSRMEIPDMGNGWWLAIGCAVSAAAPVWLLVRRGHAFRGPEAR